MLIKDATDVLRYLLTEAQRIKAVDGNPRCSRRPLVHSISTLAQEKASSHADFERLFDKITSTTEDLKARFIELKGRARADSNPPEDSPLGDNYAGNIHSEGDPLGNDHAKDTHSEDNPQGNNDVENTRSGGNYLAHPKNHLSNTTDSEDSHLSGTHLDDGDKAKGARPKPYDNIVRKVAHRPGDSRTEHDTADRAVEPFNSMQHTLRPQSTGNSIASEKHDNVIPLLPTIEQFDEIPDLIKSGARSRH
jgi:hypothetical protein